ncbi:hypothetical protein HPP92_003647 [Vanilla planifolia]|uniref:Glycosyltransferase n=1 Tax=Vanilla planifolia TaxID=51239 RepID=A0A835VNH0_VANPL|nr:hypothetical protein HPP92_003647 [Vanilla planifolia]
MGSISSGNPHAVCVPYPAQGHINPMLNLAKLLHLRGFHVTLVLTEFNYRRLVRACGPNAVQGLSDFQFATIPDGLPPSDDDATQDIPSLCASTSTTCLEPFRRLLADLNIRSPRVSCIVSDGAMSFTLDAARELDIPEVLFWTTSACGYLAYNYYRHLIDRGIVPLKDAADASNGFLETEVDWIPGLAKGIRLKDLPSFIRTTDPNDIMLNFVLRETERASMGTAIVLNSFESLEHSAIEALQKFLPPILPIGPLSLQTRLAIPFESPLANMDSSLWKEDSTCMDWLRDRKPASVVYVNFGSITVMTNKQLVEFAWGLATSGFDFLWVLRPDLVTGESAVLPPEFVEETKGRGLMASWCAQEEVLMHPAVGVFLTHSGWNSTIESLSGGVPMVCWPFFAEQQTNCRYACTEWGVGLEIDNNVRRDEVKELIKETMVGKKGMRMRNKATEWKQEALQAAAMGGTSVVNLDKMVSVLLSGRKG